MDKPAFTPHNAPITDAKLLPVRAPAQPFGRNQALASGHVALKANTSIFLHGPPGIGKSTLAAVLAAANIAKNAGGVLWFQMIEDDADQLLSRVARAYGMIGLPETLEQRRQTVKTLLEKRHPLIVLDGMTDVESVREFARTVAPGTPMILMHTEQASGPWTPIALKPLAQPDSLQLIKSLSGVKDPAAEGDLEALSRVLAGDPLALELAGRHIAATGSTPAELLGSLPLGGKLDPQQQILTVVFKNLTPAAQGVFLMLAASFAGGASGGLLAEMSNIPAAQLINIVKQLDVRGLTNESINYGQPRFRLHESVQAFARRWLEVNDRLQAAEGRALQAVLKFVKHHGRETPADHDRLASEMDNILGAAAFATSLKQADAVRDLIQSFGHDAGTFVTLRGFQTELNQLRKLQSLLRDEPLPMLINTVPTTQPIQPETPKPEIDLPLTPPERQPDIQLPPDTPKPEIDLPLTPPERQPDIELPPEPRPEIDRPDTPDKPEMPPPAPPVPMHAPEPDEEAPLARTPLFSVRPVPAEPRPAPIFGTVSTPIPPDEAVTEPVETIADWRNLSAADLRERLKRYTDRRDLAQIYETLGDKANESEGATVAIDAYSHSVENWRGTEDWAATARAMEKLGSAYFATGQTEPAAATYRLALSLAYKAGEDALRGDLLYKLGRQLVDDQRTLRQAESLLEEATTLLPDNMDVSRLLKRARQRIERLGSAANLAPALDNRMFAAQPPVPTP
jgi:energy-coupling factor transporter ATP-binding protein EcfA2